MPPSSDDMKLHGNLISDLLALVVKAEQILAEPEGDPDLCQFYVHIPGLAQDGTGDEVIECDNLATTFCRRCNKSLCKAHTQVFALTAYCPDCRRLVRAEMLAIIHEPAPCKDAL